MTVGELRKKLEIYQDDTEIFVESYEEYSYPEWWFHDPFLNREDVRTYTTKRGFTLYTKGFSHQKGSKQHTILVIS